MPAQAGIHLRLRCKAKENLDSGLRRNDEKKSRLLVDEFRSPRLKAEGRSVARPAVRGVLLAYLFLVAAPSLVQAQANFYSGKTLTVVVGSAPGGLYDLWGRLLARTMGKYIPGNPTMLVQNMPGGGSIVAANYLYGITKPDGLTIGMFQTHLYLEQLVGRPEVKFDARKFNWLGSQEKGQMMLYIRADSPYKSIDDIIRAKEAPKCGGSGSSDQSALLTRLVEETAGGKFNRILGYKGGGEVDLAMERGEVICRATRITVHFSREPFLSWEKKGFDRHLLQAGKTRDARLPDVPTIYELMDKYKTSDVGRRLTQIFLAGDELGRPMVAPPGLPADRVKVLREAYARALKDPDLIAEVDRQRLDMEPSSGEEIQTLIKELMEQKREVIERVKKLLEN